MNTSGSGKYTTIEGLIEDIKKQLFQSNPFLGGDSDGRNLKNSLTEFIKKFDNPIGLTIILDDPTGNSYVEKSDSSEMYVRTFDQNEELGLNDIKTENYET